MSIIPRTAVSALTAIGVLGVGLAGASAGTVPAPACRTVVERSQDSEVAGPARSAIVLSPCERLRVPILFGTQGTIVPVWSVSQKPAAKVLRLVSAKLGGSDASGETAAYIFLFRAVGVGPTTVKFAETTASEKRRLGTFTLRVTVRRAATGSTG